MADLLAAVGDLSDLVGESISAAIETMLLELATASVQAAAGQRIVAVTGDTVELLGTSDEWLRLPERPVTGVTAVTIDGDVVTNYALRKDSLYRSYGWRGASLEWGSGDLPTVVEVTYDHGYALGSPGAEFARSATLMVAAQMHANPTGATGLAIDDYREQYSQTGSAEMPKSLMWALRRRYGRGLSTVSFQ